MKETFWEFSKGKIVWYYLLVIVVGYFTGVFQNTTGGYLCLCWKYEWFVNYSFNRFVYSMGVWWEENQDRK